MLKCVKEVFFVESEKYAHLSEKELEKINQLENELGVILIAYNDEEVSTVDI